MVLREDLPLTASEISKRSKIPTFFAEYYEKCAPFFADLRAYRNKFIHYGERPDQLFVTERGFCVGKNAEPFCRWNVWSEESTDGNVASLRPVLAYMITNTLLPFVGFVQLMAKKIEFHPPFAPGFQVYLRGYHNAALLRALSGQAWWTETANAAVPEGTGANS